MKKNSSRMACLLLTVCMAANLSLSASAAKISTKDYTLDIGDAKFTEETLSFEHIDITGMSTYVSETVKVAHMKVGDVIRFTALSELEEMLVMILGLSPSVNSYCCANFEPYYSSDRSDMIGTVEEYKIPDPLVMDEYLKTEGYTSFMLELYIDQTISETAQEVVYIYIDGIKDLNPPVSAKPTTAPVLVDGKQIAFDAYNIAGNNYFKLRDIAQVLRGTEKQFDVTWNTEKGAIDMMNKKAYTTVGGELSAGDGKDKTCKLSTAMVCLDGEPLHLTGYTIAGNNYFKLRDLGGNFDFNVSWDRAKSAVVVDTTSSYDWEES